MLKNIFNKILPIIWALVFPIFLGEQCQGKTILIPDKIFDIEKNQYRTINPITFIVGDKQFSIDNSRGTSNFVFFWDKKLGENYSALSDELIYLMKDLDSQMNSAFDFFYSHMGFVKDDNSLINKYKINVFIYSTSQTGSLFTAYTKPIPHILLYPQWFYNQHLYLGGALHELAHVFQGCAYEEGFKPMVGYINEYCCQFMLNSYYSDWPLKEPYHINKFLNNTHLAFLHPLNCYSYPFVLEYWAQQHGRDIMGKLWRYNGSSDPITRYKQMNGFTQNDFIFEIFEAISRFPTWDLKIDRHYSEFKNKHVFNIIKLQDDSFSPSPDRFPQGYGYNAIRLTIPQSMNKTIVINFQGIKSKEIHNTRPEIMGWRYRIVADCKNKTFYSPVYSEDSCQFSYVVPNDAISLWLIVMGAPKEHYTTNKNGYCEDVFPWKVKLMGTSIMGI